MVRAADVTLLAKYVARMTAREMGMTATFMPKPLFGEAGSASTSTSRSGAGRRTPSTTRPATGA